MMMPVYGLQEAASRQAGSDDAGIDKSSSFFITCISPGAGDVQVHLQSYLAFTSGITFSDTVLTNSSTHLL